MKKLISLLIVLSLSFMLVACGSDNSRKESKDSEVTTSSSSDKKEKAEKTEKTDNEESKESKDSDKSDVSSESSESSESNESAESQKSEESTTEASEPSPTDNTIVVYNSDGEEVKLTENTDGTWTTEDGVIYYMGEDKIFRAKGYPNLYMIVTDTEESTEESNADDDQFENQSLGNSMTVYYEDGTEETVTNNVDEGTWVTSAGAVYYLGEDGVLRAKGYPDLYVENPTAK